MVDLGRLFHLPDRKGYLAELQSRIARDGLGPVAADDARALITVHRLNAGAAAKAVTSMVGNIAGQLSLADFTAGKADQLKAFAASLGVAPATIDAAVQGRAKAGFSARAAAVVKSGQVTDADFEKMRVAGRALGLGEDVQDQLYGAAAHPAVVALVQAALSDDSLSPADEARLRQAISDRFKVKPDLTGKLGQQLAHARTSWAIANGPLPIVAVPLSLQRGEAAHAAVSASAYQNATRTKAIGYAGPALRVRIAKGVYYRTGRYQVHRQTEQYEKALGHGSLVVTSKRLLFIAPDRTSSARLDSILHIEPYTDALAVVRSSGKHTTYRFDKADEWFGAILARAIHDATSG